MGETTKSTNLNWLAGFLPSTVAFGRKPGTKRKIIFHQCFRCELSLLGAVAKPSQEGQQDLSGLFHFFTKTTKTTHHAPNVMIGFLCQGKLRGSTNSFAQWARRLWFVLLTTSAEPTRIRRQ